MPLSYGLARDDPLGLKSLGISGRSMALLVVGRMLIAPLLNFCLIVAVFDWLPEDPWSRLLLMFQPAGVTANMVTMLAQLQKQPKGAQLVATAAIPQYLVYAVTATLFIALGMLWNPDLTASV